MRRAQTGPVEDAVEQAPAEHAGQQEEEVRDAVRGRAEQASEQERHAEQLDRRTHFEMELERQRLSLGELQIVHVRLGGDLEVLFLDDLLDVGTNDFLSGFCASRLRLGTGAFGNVRSIRVLELRDDPL